jgi:hypothetical protein
MQVLFYVLIYFWHLDTLGVKFFIFLNPFIAYFLNLVFLIIV